MVSLLSSTIKRVAVIDDNPEARKALAETIRDARLEPVIQENRISSFEEFIRLIPTQANAAVCDHRLTPRNYASFDGAEAVATFNSRGFPALLVTDWYNQDLDSIRLYRSKIPVMVKGRDLTQQIIVDGIQQCVNEFSQIFTKERRPWRSLLRIVSIDALSVRVVVPNWDPKVLINLPITIFPKYLGHLEPDSRFFAAVNVGAAIDSDLYFDHFEIADKPPESYAKTILS